MTKSKLRRAIAAGLCLACVILMVIGGLNLPKKDKAVGQNILNEVRTQSLLNATGEGVVETYVNIAKKQAQDKAKAEKASMAAIREAVAKAEEETRAKYADAEFSAGVTATPELLTAVAEYSAKLNAYGLIEAEAQQAYIDEHYDEALAEMEARHEQLLASGQEVPEDEEPQVDMSGFVATEEMLQAEGEVGAAYTVMAQELKINSFCEPKAFFPLLSKCLYTPSAER